MNNYQLFEVPLQEICALPTVARNDKQEWQVKSYRGYKK